MFYTFSQNNSGGYFTGPAQYLVVEATSPDAANMKAEDLGVYFPADLGDYFDGDEGCYCCGSRWSYVSSFDGNVTPTIYGLSLEVFLENTGRLRPEDGEVPEILVSYLDGTTKTY